MENNYSKVKLLLLGLAMSVSGIAGAQCLSINCPGNSSFNNDPGICGAGIIYIAPVGTSSCGQTDTIYYTGSIVNWTVPIGITSITIEARGAQGGQNISSLYTSGLGATMKGDFAVNPGDQLKILVGQQPSTNAGNGGGGGTFVTTIGNVPMIIAGGGGGSGDADDSPNKHGQVSTSGAQGSGGDGGVGGTGGNGGSIGTMNFQSGAGGGLLTNGADGWSSSTGGQSFLNGGSGGTTSAVGGFGGGGSGSAYVVGGGGGGYSGGGSASNTLGGGVGGGGGSYNVGTNQVNNGGVNTGNGMVIISYGGVVTPVTGLYSGLGSGATFPVGTTTETYYTTDGTPDTAFCSFSITITDNEDPVITCPGNVSTCFPIVTGIAPVSVTDNCTGTTVVYTLAGATTGSGSTDASNGTFNFGTTTVAYTAIDASGNASSCAFDVTVTIPPAVDLPVINPDSVCVNDPAMTIPAGTPAGGTYSGAGVSGTTFTPGTAGVGTHWVVYTYTSGNCTVADSSMIVVIGCVNVKEVQALNTISISPNPTNGNITIELGALYQQVDMQIMELSGKVVKSEKYKSVREIKTNIEDLSAGVYFLSVRTEYGTSNVKLIKK